MEMKNILTWDGEVGSITTMDSCKLTDTFRHHKDFVRAVVVFCKRFRSRRRRRRH